MPEGHDEAVTQSAPSQGFIHDLCDEFERDRQASSSVAWLPYIERAPEALRQWICKELLAIELEIRQAAGESVDRQVLLKSSGMPAECFDAAWSQLHDAAKTITINASATKPDEGKLRDDKPDQGKSTIYFQRGTKAVTDSLEFATYLPNAETTVGDAGPRSKKLPLVADDFEIIDMLGEGGMGVVYRAYQHSLQRQVALKIIPQRYINSPQVLARFFIEVEATASMNHPGIVPVYEFGERNGVNFYAMALVEGGNLSKYVGTATRPPKQRMEPRQVAEIICRVTEAVQYAHDHAVIHRDIKPANILLDETGRPLLADFGLAKILDKDEESLTLTGNVLGTPAYMAPEQASGKKVGISNRTDVYSLGATMYGLLTGRRPFEGEGQFEVIRKVVQTSPAPIGTLAPALPLDLQTICEKCLAKLPDERYGSARELGEDLRLYLDGYPISARPLGPIQRCVSWCRRNPVVAFWGSVVGLVLLSAAIVSNVYRLRAVDSAEEATKSLDNLRANLIDTDEKINSSEFANEPSVQPLRKSILNSNKRYYLDLIAELKGDSSLQLEYAAAQVSLGKVSSSLSLWQDAQDAFEAAEESLHSLVVAEPNDVEAILLLASTHFELGRLGKKKWDRYQDPQNKEASSGLQQWQKHSRKALRLRERVTELVPSSTEYQRLFASSQESLAMALADGGIASEDADEINQAIILLDRAQATRRKSLESHENDPALVLGLARGFGNLARLQLELAMLYRKQENESDSRRCLQEVDQAALRAIDTYQPVRKKFRENLRTRSEFANCHTLRGNALEMLERFDVAEQHYLQAIQELEIVCAKSPLVYSYTERLVDAQLRLANFYFRVEGQSYKGLLTLDKVRSTLFAVLIAKPNNRKAEEKLLDGMDSTVKKLIFLQAEDKSELRYNFLQKTIADARKLFAETEDTECASLKKRVYEGYYPTFKRAELERAPDKVGNSPSR